MEALEGCPTALIVLDETQCFVRVNRAACTLFGRSSDDLLGRCAIDLLAPEPAADAARGPGPGAGAPVVDPGGQEDWCFARRDGSLVWGRVRMMFVAQGAARPAIRVALIDDVTESRRARASEHVLFEDLRRYQGMFERGSIGQLTLKMPEFRISAVNQAFCTMTGYLRAELLGGDAGHLFMHASPWDYIPTESLMRGDIESYVVERDLPHRDGHLVAVVNTVSAVRSSAGGVTHLSVLVLALTSQRAAEHARSDSQMVLEAAIASSQVAVTTFDRDLRFTFLAGGSLARHGREPADFLGRDVRDVYDDALTISALERALEGHESASRSEYGGRTYSTIFAPLRQHGGEITGVISVANDITPEVAAEAAGAHNRSLLGAVLNAFPMLVASFDAAGRVIDGIGRLWATVDGGAGHEVGQRLDAEGTNVLNAHCVDRAISGEEVTVVVEQGGSWYQSFYRPNPATNGEVAGALVVVTDVTARQRADADTDFHARHDGLTGLPVRVMLLEHLETVLGAQEQPCSLFLLDLDDLQGINDSLGHDTGDAVLIAVGASLTTACPGLMVTRMGGDEFAVALPGIAVENDGHDLVQRIREALSAVTTVEDHPVRVTASIGIAHARAGGSARVLLRDADSALYEAKHQGRGQHRIYDADTRRRRQERLATEKDLREALVADALHLEYQPIVHLADGRIVGVEALLRWDHPIRGTIPPNDFISIAEATGLIIPIGEWVMRRACADAADLYGVHDLRVNVNVAARQLRSGDFSAWLDEILASTRLAGSGLTVEVTESALLDDFAQVRKSFNSLRARGVRIAIDDFGTGFSSLARLQQLPVDIIKLDRAFVIDVAERPAARTMAAAIFALSKAIGADIVAEGVETEAQAATLADLGYRKAQGFLFARAMPLPALLQLLDASPSDPRPRLSHGGLRESP